MLFQKKKTATKPELDLHVFQTKVELRRLQERYQNLLERELRQARLEVSGGAARPSNQDRIKTIYYLLQTTDEAYQELNDISTTDELNRTTNDLNAALKRVDQIAATSQRADVGSLKRGLDQLQSNEEAMHREYRKENKVLSQGTAHRYDAELEELLGQVPPAPASHRPEPSRAPGGTAQPQSDEELQAELDAINRHLNNILEDL